MHRGCFERKLSFNRDRHTHTSSTQQSIPSHTSHRRTNNQTACFFFLQVQKQSLKKIDTSLTLKDIDVGGYDKPSKISPTYHSWLSGEKSVAAYIPPSGKLSVYEQNTWSWPPPDAVTPATEESVLVTSPRLYDNASSRNMDFYPDVESVNASDFMDEWIKRA